MGNRSGAAVDAAERKKKKKKGRPSLLDLQKRSLRLQNHQQQNNRSPNPNLESPPQSTITPSRRVTRGNTNPPQGDPPASPPQRDEDEEDDGSGGKRREKKLKLVLRLPLRSASDSDGATEPDPKRRKTGHGDCDQKVAMDSVQATGEQSDLGPTTPLPDKKLLVFILDRVQKKDTYGVFSEPVDPEELPDYHEVVEHPMDFGTVRKKLLSGAYANLEQFENDVFLISSNAMRYNAPDTIYYRQARSIQELAQKQFENLRQESDDDEPEPKKVVRRGRPPNKNKNLGRPPDRAASDFSSDAILAKAGDITHQSNLPHDMPGKGSAGDMPQIADISNRALYGLCSTDKFGWISERKADRDEEYSGSALKGIPTKYGKKPIFVDENRRNTYKQSLTMTYVHELPIFSTFVGEKKQLVPVGLHLEYAYARSLARFAAKLGPIGWVLAAKRIRKVLPPGTKFGPGWLIDSEASQHSQPPILSASQLQPSAKPCTTSRTDKQPLGPERPQDVSVIDECELNRTDTPASNSVAPGNPSSFPEHPLPGRAPNHENGSSASVSGSAGSDTIRPKAPFQHHQSPEMPPIFDGFNASFNLNIVSQLGKLIRPAGMLSAPFSSDAQTKHPQMTNARALDLVSRAHSNNFIHQTSERATLVDNSTMGSSDGPLPDPGGASKGPCQSVTLQPKLDSVPPDLNVGFQSPGSPASGALVESQQPDLALQL